MTAPPTIRQFEENLRLLSGYLSPRCILLSSYVQRP